MKSSASARRVQLSIGFMRADAGANTCVGYRRSDSVRLRRYWGWGAVWDVCDCLYSMVGVGCCAHFHGSRRPLKMHWNIYGDGPDHTFSCLLSSPNLLSQVPVSLECGLDFTTY